MSGQFDVIVVGAGLVGASFALAMKDSGLKLALVESAAPSVPAPEWNSRVYAISPGSVEFLSEIGAWREFDAARIAPVLGMRIHGDDGKAHLEFDAQQSGLTELAVIAEARWMQHGLWRALQRQENLELFCPARCASFRLQEEGAVLRLEDGRELRAALIVGADGRNSWVAHHLGMARGVANNGGRIGFQMRRKYPPGLRGRVEIHLFPGGYAGLLGLGDGTINLCLAADRRRLGSHVGIDALVESYLPHNPHLKVILDGSETLGAVRSTYPVYFPPRRSVADRVLLIGDAARVNEPVSGEGIFFALRSAAIAAQVIDRAFIRGDVSARELVRSEQRCRAEFRLRRGLNGGIRFLMYRPALLAPFIQLSGKRNRLLESLVHAICRSEATA